MRRLNAAIPLPKRVSPPVTEVCSSRLTKLMVSRENELGLRGSPRGVPSEGRAGHQRDQRESSDSAFMIRLHIAEIVLRLCISEGQFARRAAVCRHRKTDRGETMFIPEIARIRGEPPQADM